MNPIYTNRAATVLSLFSPAMVEEIRSYLSSRGYAAASELEEARARPDSVPSLFKLFDGYTDPEDYFHAVLGFTALAQTNLGSLTDLPAYKKVFAKLFGLAEPLLTQVTQGIETAQAPIGLWANLKYGTQALMNWVIPKPFEFKVGNETANFDYVYELLVLGERLARMGKRATGIMAAWSVLPNAAQGFINTEVQKQIASAMTSGDPIDPQTAEEIGDLTDADLHLAQLGDIYASGRGAHMAELGGPYAAMFQAGAGAVKKYGPTIAAKIKARKAEKARKKAEREAARAAKQQAREEQSANDEEMEPVNESDVSPVISDEGDSRGVTVSLAASDHWNEVGDHAGSDELITRAGILDA